MLALLVSYAEQRLLRMMLGVKDLRGQAEDVEQSWVQSKAGIKEALHTSQS